MAEAECPLSGPVLNNCDHVSVLKYADDVALLATSPSQLQDLVRATSDFYSAVGLLISLSKSSVMTFSVAPQPPLDITSHGQVIACVSQARYLGLVFDEKHGSAPSCQARRFKLLGAWAVLQRQYAGLRCSLSLQLIVQLYNACVLPTGSYGAEVWAFQRMCAGHARVRQNIEFLRLLHLCQLAGLRKTVSGQIVLEEFQCLPMRSEWIRSQTTFWNNLVKLGGNSLYKAIPFDDVIDAEIFQHKNWTHFFYQQLDQIGYSVIHGVGHLQGIDHTCVAVLLQENFSRLFTSTDVRPRTCESEGGALCTYHNWFRLRSSQAVNFLKKVNYPAHISLIRTFLRFRLGSPNLPNVLGRFLRVPRCQRVCHVCHATVIGDEYHLVFECAALSALRASYSRLFGPVIRNMQQFVWQKDLLGVMHYVKDALAVLTDIIT